MITVYSKENCPNCEQAKNILTSKGIAFEVVMIDVGGADGLLAHEFMRSEGHRSVPQIYKDGKLFVQNGHFGLRRMMLEGKLVA